MFASILEWENLLHAYRKAAKGKRGKPAAAGFEHQIADHLLDLQSDLATGNYRPGAYTHFTIHEPKKRKISAAPFRDRVVHHALCNVIEPLFEAQFSPHSYANRVGKGTHRSIDRLQMLAQQYRYVLRADIIKHFPSIDHALLRDILGDTIHDEQTRELIRQIIASGEGVLTDEYANGYFLNDDIFAVTRPRGLPIGNLTSQFWSNCTLNPLDRFIEQDLGCGAYLRYVDDFALFGDNKHQLYTWKQALIGFLARLRLVIHESQAQVVACIQGVPWLGFIVYPTHRHLKARNVVKFTQRFERNIDLYEKGQIPFAELDASVQGWINHVRYADTWGLRGHIFDSHPITPRQIPARSPD